MAKKIGFPRRFILLDDKYRSIPENIFNLLHEIGHTVCFAKKCKCFNDTTRVLPEFHAYQYALKRVMEIPKGKEVIKCAAWHIKEVGHSDGYHGDSCRKLMKTKLWKSACQRISTYITC